MNTLLKDILLTESKNKKIINEAPKGPKDTTFGDMGLIENSEQLQAFYDNQVQMADLNAQLKKLKAENADFTKELDPYFKKLSVTGIRVIKGANFVIKIARMGSWDKQTVSYKDAFELLLTKVNKYIRAIIERALVDTMKFSNVATSFSIQPLEEGKRLNEGLIDNIKNIFSKYFTKATLVIAKLFTPLDESLAELEELCKLLEKISNSKSTEVTENKVTRRIKRSKK